MEEFKAASQHADGAGIFDMQEAEGGSSEPETDTRALLGLSIALDHPALSSDPQVLCAAARACKAWREAVQQCGACNTAIAINASRPLLQLRSFAQWLQKHAALVKSITVTTAGPGLGRQPDIQAAQQVLQQALQEAAAASRPLVCAAVPPQPSTAESSHTAAAAATTGGTSTPGLSVVAAAEPGSAAAHSAARDVGHLQQQQQQQQQQQRGLRLASFSSNLPTAPDLLHVLPAHSLIHLHLHLQPGVETERAAVELTQLARLSSLQQLCLECRTMRNTFAQGCLAGIAQLSTLTSLEVRGLWKGISEQLQQLLNKPLPLRQLQLRFADFDAQGNVYSLSHLTQLTELCTENVGKHAPLPAQLLRLAVYDCSDLAPMLGLQQLQHLTVVPHVYGRAEQQQLLELVQLPGLQTLALTCSGVGFEDAAAAAPAWALLPQLRQLRVEYFTQGWEPEAQVLYEQAMAAVMAGAAAATHLVSLQLQPSPGGRMGRKPGPVALCAGLAGLTGLRQLVLADVSLVPGDTLALTALTGLTWLDLCGTRDGVGNAAAAALTGSMKQLCYLDLRWCSVDLGDMEILEGIGQLTRLTVLYLRGNSGLTQLGLMQLTRLTKLQQLTVDKNEEVTDEALGQYWAAVRLQQRFSQ